jgi:preprotein translocase subunit SecE
MRDLFSFGLYKRNQGRIARQATFAALAVLVGLGGWSLSAYSQEYGKAWQFGVWASFRVVNFPAFADFLISVEGEMNKVSWPSRNELFRASIVVILVIFFLAGLLYLYDAMLSWIMMGIDGLVDSMFG